MKKWEELPNKIGMRKQKWIENPDRYCEPPYNCPCKLCLKTCVNRGGKTRNRCGFKKAR